MKIHREKKDIDIKIFIKEKDYVSMGANLKDSINNKLFICVVGMFAVLLCACGTSNNSKTKSPQEKIIIPDQKK